MHDDAAILAQLPGHRSADRSRRHGMIAGQILVDEAGVASHLVVVVQQIGQRGESSLPQRDREDQPGADDAQAVRERLGVGRRDPITVRHRGRSDDRLGAEPRGEEACRDQPRPEPTPRDEVIILGGDAPRDIDPDRELGEEIHADSSQERRHEDRVGRSTPQYTMRRERPQALGAVVPAGVPDPRSPVMRATSYTFAVGRAILRASPNCREDWP